MRQRSSQGTSRREWFAVCGFLLALFGAAQAGSLFMTDRSSSSASGTIDTQVNTANTLTTATLNIAAGSNITLQRQDVGTTRTVTITGAVGSIALQDGTAVVDTAMSTMIVNQQQFDTSGSAGTRQVFIATGGVTADSIATDAVGVNQIVSGAPGAAGAELADTVTNTSANTTLTLVGAGSGGVSVGTEAFSFSNLDGAAGADADGDIPLRQAGKYLRLPKGGASTVLQISSASTVQYGTVTAAMVTANTLTANEIAANAIGTSELADNAVDTAAIADTAVTLAKIQNAVASSKLLGSGSSGAGAAYAELTLGTNLSMAGTTLNASIAVQDGATVVDAATGTLIFEGSQFIGTSGPAGSASIALATGSVTVDSLGAGSVTYPKIQNVTDARLLGNASGAPAAPSEISASGGLTLSGGALTWDGMALLDGATSVDTALKTVILSGAQFGTSGSAGVRQIFIDTGGVTVDSLAANSVTAAKIVDGTITDGDVAAANKDGAQGTASMRTIAGTPVALGTAAAIGSGQTAAAYDHVHAAPAVTVNGTAHGATTTLNVSAGFGFTSGTSGGTTTVTLSSPILVSGGYVDRPSGSNDLRFMPDVSDRVFCYENSTWTEKKIPAAIGATCTSLSASTVYYAYVADLTGNDNTIDSFLLSTTAPVTVTGVAVMSGQPFRTLVARCYANASGNILTYVQDASAQLVCNTYNKRQITLLKQISVASWTYATASYRAAENNASGVWRVDVMTDGTSGVSVHALVTGSNSGGGQMNQGIGLDTSTANNATTACFPQAGAGVILPAPSSYMGILTGWHYFQMVEYAGTPTTTYYGSNATGITLIGMF